MSKVIVDEIQTDTSNGNVRVIPNGTGALEVKGDGSSNDAKLQLNCYANSHGVKIKSPAHSVSQEYTMILPDNNIAADKYLKVKSIVSGSGTSAVGQLEFGDVAAGVSSDAKFNTLGGTGAGSNLTLSSPHAYEASNNTAFGYNALNSATTAGRHTAIGYEALKSLTTGSQNTAIGYHALTLATTAIENIAIGHDCMSKGVVTGFGYNIGIGYQALEDVTSGSHNIAIGREALDSITTTNYNTAIGSYAARNLQTGEYNTIVGYEAASTGAFTGSGNSILGTFSGFKLTSGTNNCIMGRSALYETTTGGSNTSIGTYSGYSVTTGSNNTLIGYSAGYSSSPSGSITTGSNNVVLGNNSVSNLYCADTSISSSDSRDKTDVTSFTIGLNWIEALRPVTYRWDRRTWYGTDAEPFGTPDGSKKRQRLHLGFLAQEALAVEQANGYGTNNDDSLILNLTDDGMSYGMKYERLVPILVNAIKELSARVKTLEGG